MNIRMEVVMEAVGETSRLARFGDGRPKDTKLGEERTKTECWSKAVLGARRRSRSAVEV